MVFPGQFYPGLVSPGLYTGVLQHWVAEGEGQGDTKEISLGRLREPRTLASLGLPGEQKFLPLAFSPMSLKHPSNTVPNTDSRGILYPQ